MTADELDNAWYKLQFGVRRSVRYHQRRRKFFQTLDALIAAIFTLLGLALIYGALSQSTAMVLTAAVLVTLAAILHAVFAPAYCTWQHADFARRFIRLECRLLAQPDEVLLHQITAERLMIELDEPPVLRVLDSLCHNEQLRTEGRNECHLHVGFWQRLFAQLFDLRAQSIGYT